MFSVRLSLCSWKKSWISVGIFVGLLDDVDDVADDEAGAFLERDGRGGGGRAGVVMVSPPSFE